jgi:hypothetical protein
VSKVVEIELSRDEDSVTSLAISQSSETSITAFAGINSSEADQKAGKNEHLRSFRLDYPQRRQPDGGVEKSTQHSGKTEALGQAALFSKPQGEKDGVYQRIIRLSPSRNSSPRPVAAISTGLALRGEIVVFRSDSLLKNPEILGRISLEKDEAADLDIWAGEEADTAVLSYCTSLQVFIYALSLSKSSALSEPIPVYSIPTPDAFKSPTRPKLRSLRFLSPRHILLLANRPERAGADLIVLKLDRLGNLGNSTLQKRLSKSTKAAVGLEVCFLSSSIRTGERQILIAVAGQNGSIELLTMEYSPNKGLGKFNPYTIIRDIHPASITKLALSTFTPPPGPITPSTRPQSVKLGSVSVGQTVVVHTLPLCPHPAPSSSRQTSESPRYILARPGASQALQNTFSVFMAIVVISIASLLLQAFMEIRLGMNGSLGASGWSWISPKMRDLIQKPLTAPAPPPPAVAAVVSGVSSAVEHVLPSEPPVIVASATSKLSALLSAEQGNETPRAIVVRDEGTDLSTELHPLDADVVREETVRKWEELSEERRGRWRTRLKEAGHWAEEQGEAVLKGVFFREVAAVVAGVVGAPLNE